MSFSTEVIVRNSKSMIKAKSIVRTSTSSKGERFNKLKVNHLKMKTLLCVLVCVGGLKRVWIKLGTDNANELCNYLNIVPPSHLWGVVVLVYRPQEAVADRVVIVVVVVVVVVGRHCSREGGVWGRGMVENEIESDIWHGSIGESEIWRNETGESEI